MKANIIQDRCKLCGKDTSDVEFMAMDTTTGKFFDICVNCLKQQQQGEQGG